MSLSLRQSVDDHTAKSFSAANGAPKNHYPCLKCQRGAAGHQYLCRGCWETASPEEREKYPLRRRGSIRDIDFGDDRADGLAQHLAEQEAIGSDGKPDTRIAVELPAYWAGHFEAGRTKTLPREVAPFAAALPAEKRSRGRPGSLEKIADLMRRADGRRELFGDDDAIGIDSEQAQDDARAEFMQKLAVYMAPSGIEWNKETAKWRLHPFVGKCRHHLGYFEKEALGFAIRILKQYRLECKTQPCCTVAAKFIAAYNESKKHAPRRGRMGGKTARYRGGRRLVSDE